MNANINENELKLLAYLHEDATGYDVEHQIPSEHIMQGLGMEDLEISGRELRKWASYLEAHGLVGMVKDHEVTFETEGETPIAAVWITGSGENFMRELEERLKAEKKEPGPAKTITAKVVQEGWVVLKGIAVNVLSEFVKKQF